MYIQYSLFYELTARFESEQDEVEVIPFLHDLIKFKLTAFAHVLPGIPESIIVNYSPFHSGLPFEHLHHTRRPCVPKI